MGEGAPRGRAGGEGGGGALRAEGPKGLRGGGRGEVGGKRGGAGGLAL